MGGLPRRNQVLADERSKGPVAVVDAGQTLAPSRVDEREREQRLAKAELIAKAYAAGGIDAMALGAQDWGLGVDFVRGLVDRHRLPIVAANLVCGGSMPYPGHRTVEAGGVRVGIVGATEGHVEGCEVGEPVVALVEAIDELGDVDVTVVLLPHRDHAVEAIAAELAVDLVVHGRAGRITATPEPLDGRWLFFHGAEGKFLGVADLELVPGASSFTSVHWAENLEQDIVRIENRITAAEGRISQVDEAEAELLRKQIAAYREQLENARQRKADWAGDARPKHRVVQRNVSLSAEIADHPETKAMLDETLLQIEGMERPGGFFLEPRRTPAGSPYAGGEECVACHRKEHVQWSATSHAHAYQTLIAQKRSADADCYGCHVTGQGRPGGPSSPAETLGLHDVQCEACHGPSRAHAMAPAEASPGHAVSVEVCATCHDGQRDGGRFDRATYWPRIVHGEP